MALDSLNRLRSFKVQQKRITWHLLGGRCASVDGDFVTGASYGVTSGLPKKKKNQEKLISLSSE